jgi:hypothetical protein
MIRRSYKLSWPSSPVCCSRSMTSGAVEYNAESLRLKLQIAKIAPGASRLPRRRAACGPLPPLRSLTASSAPPARLFQALALTIGAHWVSSDHAASSPGRRCRGADLASRDGRARANGRAMSFSFGGFWLDNLLGLRRGFVQPGFI